MVGSVCMNERWNERTNERTNVTYNIKNNGEGLKKQKKKKKAKENVNVITWPWVFATWMKSSLTTALALIHSYIHIFGEYEYTNTHTDAWNSAWNKHKHHMRLFCCSGRTLTIKKQNKNKKE